MINFTSGAALAISINIMLNLSISLAISRVHLGNKCAICCNFCLNIFSPSSDSIEDFYYMYLCHVLVLPVI